MPGGVGSARASEAADNSGPWPDPLVIGNLDDARGEVRIISAGSKRIRGTAPGN